MSTGKLTWAELRDFFDSIPFNRHIGVRLTGVHKDGVSLECRLRPELMNGMDVLHGGVTATIADVAAGAALANHLGRLKASTTVEMKISYLRPVLTGKLRARARLLRVGSTLCTGRVDLTDGARQLVATALVTYMILK